MSNTGLIIEERSRDIGDFLVGRLLPFRKKRMVGPFIYLDHMGPKELGPGERMDIGPHPHIGLSTLTYLFSGSIVHRDSLGSEQIINPGAVNWMTAGSGVVHSERSPHKLDDDTQLVHGLQIWVALPKPDEDTEASFHHITSDELPSWKNGQVSYKLLAGKAYGRQSPVPVYSDLFLVELKNEETEEIHPAEHVKGELAIYVLKGEIEACGDVISSGHLLVSKEGEACTFRRKAGSHCIMLGGEAFPEERHIYWNFVSSSKDKIEAAKQRWKDRAFPGIPGEKGYIPLPE